MPDAPANSLSLLDQLNARFEKLRANDAKLRSLQREIDRQREKMRVAYQFAKIARLAQREHEKWLKEEAAAQVRKEAGVQTIPGFASRRESAIAFRQSLTAKMKAAQAAARDILTAPTPPP